MLLVTSFSYFYKHHTSPKYKRQYKRYQEEWQSCKGLFFVVKSYNGRRTTTYILASLRHIFSYQPISKIAREKDRQAFIVTFSVNQQPLQLLSYSCLGTIQRYTYRVLQTIQMRLKLLYVWAELAVLGIAKTALKFKYEI